MQLSSVGSLWQRRSRIFSLIAALAILFSLGFWQVSLAKAAGPEEDLTRITTHIESALKATQVGDLETAQKEFKTFSNQWFEIEDGVKAKSKDAYRTIEEKMSDISFAFSKKPVDQKEVITALTALDNYNKDFSKGETKAPPNPTTSAPAEKPTISSVLGKLDEARDFMAKSNYTAAASEVKEFQQDWLEVEGQVKTRSAQDYVQTENDMALAYSLLTQNSPTAKAVLDRMYTRLEPYKNAGNYGIFDATAILLREGLEALLVVVALLTFLKKSGNADKQPWIWGGALVGLALSIILAIAIQLLFSNLINASNRELIEGSVGLVAAAMLFYVSYWMHSKSSAVAWQRYIRQKSTAALATGSLFGLGLLSFLAIFREGAETALFYLGIGPSISASDLWIGMGIGTLALVILGVLLMVVGLRIPMGPFFTVASLLVFFLCFKFIGTGVHALQVANVLPTHSADYLPANDFLGLFPTWETTIVQALVLVVGIGIVVYGRLKKETPDHIEPVKTSTPATASK